MLKLPRFSGAVVFGVFCCSIVYGQSPEATPYSRDNCIKVKEGKGAEYEAYLKEVAKLYKVRVEDGSIQISVIAQAVSPQGRSARCDYHFYSIYPGFPPEASGPEKVAADMKKAGITMSREAMLAKRDELSYLVSTDVWRGWERIGRSEKGNYARINFFKVKAGMGGDWLRAERAGWKQLAEENAKQNPGEGWRLSTLAMPGGTSLAYNAMTIDIFPSWEALGKGTPVRAIWNKVHPNMDFTTYMDRVGALAERPRTDVVKLIEVFQK